MRPTHRLLESILKCTILYEYASVIIFLFVVLGGIESLIARCDHLEYPEACITTPLGRLDDFLLYLDLAVVDTQQVFRPVCPSFKLLKLLPRTLHVVFGCLPFGHRTLELTLHLFDVLPKLCYVRIAGCDEEQFPLHPYLSGLLSEPRYIHFGSHLCDSLHDTVNKYLRVQFIERRDHWLPKIFKNVDLLNQVIQVFWLWAIASNFRGNFGDSSAYHIPSSDNFVCLIFVGQIPPFVSGWCGLIVTLILVERKCIVPLERLGLDGRPVEKSNVIENCGDSERRQSYRILADWREHLPTEKFASEFRPDCKSRMLPFRGVGN